jgi:hypothetical protein
MTVEPINIQHLKREGVLPPTVWSTWGGLPNSEFPRGSTPPEEPAGVAIGSRSYGYVDIE